MTAQEFEEKYVVQAPHLYEVAYSLLQNQQDAEDVVQDTLVKLWRDADRIDHLQNSQGYLLRMLRNGCIDLLRERRNETELESFENTLPETEPPPETETEEKVRFILRNLPARARQIVTMRHVAECSIDEICEVTGDSPMNVRQILSRSRRKIIEQFKTLKI